MDPAKMAILLQAGASGMLQPWSELETSALYNSRRKDQQWVGRPAFRSGIFPERPMKVQG